MKPGESAQGTEQSSYSVVPRVICFLRHGEDVLLLRGAPDKRLWANLYNGVGGHVERGEDPYQATRREILEETGLEVQDLHLAGVVHVTLSEGPGVLIFLFTGQAPHRDVRPSTEGALEWIPSERIRDLPVLEDLPALLPRVLDAPPGASPFFARSHYDAEGRIRVEFSERKGPVHEEPEHPATDSSLIKTAPIPPLPGTYVLVLKLTQDRRIPVGRLGEVPLRAGYYLYVGSARGPGGLCARLRRHLRRDKPAHWHIDSLRQWAEPVEVWFVTSSEPHECDWRALLQQAAGLALPLPGFGASDCRCRSHLLYSPRRPTAAVREILERRTGLPVQVVLMDTGRLDDR